MLPLKRWRDNIQIILLTNSSLGRVATMQRSLEFCSHHSLERNDKVFGKLFRKGLVLWECQFLRGRLDTFWHLRWLIESQNQQNVRDWNSGTFTVNLLCLATWQVILHGNGNEKKPVFQEQLLYSWNIQELQAHFFGSGSPQNDLLIMIFRQDNYNYQIENFNRMPPFTEQGNSACLGFNIHNILLIELI